MPINLEDFSKQLDQFVEKAKSQGQDLKKRLNKAKMLFDSLDHNNEELLKQFEVRKNEVKNLRCAIPIDEPLSFSKPADTDHLPQTIIGVDGSQIYPDRHSGLAYHLINLACVSLNPKSSSAPLIATSTEFKHLDLLSTNLPGRDQIDRLRDIKERNFLAEKAKEAPKPVVALTDGLLGLYHKAERDIVKSSAFEQDLKKYKASLTQLKENGAITAGYVDKPGANYVVRLLELANADEKELTSLHSDPPLGGVSDRHLFALKPGHRSAIFGIHSKTSEDYEGEHALHFFYLNTDLKPSKNIARVDFPKWVADTPEMIDMLHNAIIEQCNVIDTVKYPYCLNRAHEEAVVTRDLQQKMDDWIRFRLDKNKVPTSNQTEKAKSKER